jgi:5-formyltetrahydrofolate cyclo-ligase
VIVTLDEVIRTRGARRPRGILWEDLDEEKLAEIPVLRGMRA